MYVDKLDGRIDVAFFDRMSVQWRDEQARCLRDIEHHQTANQTYLEEGIHLMELARSAQRLFERQNAREKRRLLNFVVSNCSWKGGKLTVLLRQPFDLLANPTFATGPRFWELRRLGFRKSLKSAESVRRKLRTSLAVPTKSLAERPGALEACRHVSAPQGSPERRQGAPLLEHRGKPSSIRRSDGAAPRAVPGRDQRQPAYRLVPNDRGVRRARPTGQTDRAVPGGSNGAGAELRCRACPARRAATASATAMGRLLAGLPCVGSVATG